MPQNRASTNRFPSSELRFVIVKTNATPGVKENVVCDVTTRRPSRNTALVVRGTTEGSLPPSHLAAALQAKQVKDKTLTAYAVSRVRSGYKPGFEVPRMITYIRLPDYGPSEGLANILHPLSWMWKRLLLLGKRIVDHRAFIVGRQPPT